MEKIGKYLLKEYIASGGMAEIYKGSLEGPHGFVKEVVIKAIHPHLLKDERYIKLFLREAKLWAKLNHSSIVQVYEFFEEKNRYYLVMEYVRGTDLLNVIKRSQSKGRPIGIPRTIKIFEYVLSALGYAHNFRDDSENIYGIVHRDISPQNILISVNGDVKITDFGIAKASLSTGLTTQGAIIGKIDYMSPEQALGKDVDLRTDIFSTGVVLWETLTGNKLFDGKNDIELLENVRRCEIIGPSSINPEIDERLERIIMKALSYDPEFRYKSAVEFSNELKSYVKDYPHGVEEENIGDFMKELFPEYVKDYTHRTEVLEEESEDKRSAKNKKMVIVPVILLLAVISVLAVLLYPRSYEEKGFSNDTVWYDITAVDRVFASGDSAGADISEEDVMGIEPAVTDAEKEPVHEESARDKKALKNPVLKQPDEAASKTAEIRKGRLSLNAIPWADVYIGKKKIGTTPVFDYELKSGSVEVTFRNEDLNVVRKKILVIEPGKETKYTEDLTK